VKDKRTLTKWISVIVLILLWQLVASLFNSPVILPSPYAVLKELLWFFGQQSFYKNLGATVLRALESFFIIVISGSLIGILAGSYKSIETALMPLISVFKATPVMSVILIAFIWFRTGAVPVFSAFLMAFPIMFVQTIQGYKNLDNKLIQMCDIYQVYGWKRFVGFTVPALMPSLVTGAKQSLSMIWKVVIAAEVLTIPNYGIGKDLQLSQIQLETSKVFGWTIVAILLTALCDYLLDILLKKILGRRLLHETH